MQSIVVPNISVAKHELPTSIIGTVRHVLSRIICIKQNIANKIDKILQVIMKISIEINQDSMLALVAIEVVTTSLSSLLMNKNTSVFPATWLLE